MSLLLQLGHAFLVFLASLVSGHFGVIAAGTALITPVLQWVILGRLRLGSSSRVATIGVLSLLQFVAAFVVYGLALDLDVLHCNADAAKILFEQTFAATAIITGSGSIIFLGIIAALKRVGIFGTIGVILASTLLAALSNLAIIYGVLHII